MLSLDRKNYQTTIGDQEAKMKQKLNKLEQKPIGIYIAQNLTLMSSQYKIKYIPACYALWII